MGRRRQGQAVDERGGVGDAGSVEVWVLIQRSGVTGDGAVKARAGYIGVEGGRKDGRGRGDLGLEWGRGRRAVVRAHLLGFDLRFPAAAAAALGVSWLVT